jgi:hypothetical protein
MQHFSDVAPFKKRLRGNVAQERRRLGFKTSKGNVTQAHAHSIKSPY